jgi:vanillate O-demethylase ferredoxin subunit
LPASSSSLPTGNLCRLFRRARTSTSVLKTVSCGSTRSATTPGESHRYLIAVLKDPATRGGSKAMHERIGVGDELQISLPKNHFPLAPDAKRHVLLAGGIGITPILCMAERLALVGGDFELHYCVRSRERTAFLERIANSSFGPRVQFHFDDGPREQRLDLPAC